VALCAVVAIYIPFIGVSLGAGFVVSLVAAAIVIRRRRTAGPLPSSSHAVGASTMLMLGDPPGAPRSDREAARRRDSEA